MSFAEMQYYGNGRIICDTSTFSVGDKIRVKSMVDNTKVWDKTVETVGTPLVYDVPSKDYYKICIVQTISDVETEIGGVYRTLDFGQTIFVDVLDKKTLAGIQGILNAHQEANVLNIGDELDITVNGSPWTMQIAGIDLNDSHEVIFASKLLWSTSAFSSGNNYTASNAYLREKMTSFYNAISANEKQYLKTAIKCGKVVGTGTTYYQFEDYVYPPTALEVGGTAPSGTPTITLHQYPLFATDTNRVKYYNSTATDWLTCDGGTASAKATDVSSAGAVRFATASTTTTTLGVLPCFRLTADS